MSPPSTIGVVLAGGRARRMGGGDKALLMLGGTSLIARVIARLAPQCARVVLNANGDPARFASFGLPVVADDVPGFAGPLAGILAGLDWLAAHEPAVEWLASVPGDCPFVPGDLVPRLHAARRAAGTPLACAVSGGRRHPAAALWPVGLRADLRRALTQEGLHKVEAWAEQQGVAFAEWPDRPLDPFFNVNRPEDLAEAERLLQLTSEP